MDTKKFVTRTITKVLVFVFCMIVLSSIGQAMSPVISNEMAMTQMENSNELFVAMDTYNRLKPVWTGAFTLVVVLFVYTIFRDIYKFIKNRINTAENEKEN